MKATTGIGIAMAFVALMVASLMEGSNPMAFINIPALLIVVAGTLGAVIASSDMSIVKALPKLAITAVKGGAELDAKAASRQMVAIAEKARRDGLLALENDLAEIEDDFTRKGLQLVVDGTESDLVIAILQSELDSMGHRHNRNIKLFKDAG